MVKLVYVYDKIYVLADIILSNNQITFQITSTEVLGSCDGNQGEEIPLKGQFQKKI